MSDFNKRYGNQIVDRSHWVFDPFDSDKKADAEDNPSEEDEAIKRQARRQALDDIGSKFKSKLRF